MLTKRRIEIFKAIVTEFVKNAEPVGSKSLIEKYQWPYSSATIRNEMSVLEELGLLEKTHTSSGRVPSIKGYQFYTQHLLDDPKDNRMEIVLNDIFSRRQQSIEDALQHSITILSEMTNLTTAVLGPHGSKQKLLDIDVIEINDKQGLVVFTTDHNHCESKVFNVDEKISMNDLHRYVEILNKRLIGTPINQILEKMNSLRPILETMFIEYERLFTKFANAFVKFASDKMYFSGRNNLLNHPEFQEAGKMQELLKALENSSLWFNIISDQNTLSQKTSDHSTTFWHDELAVVASTIEIKDESHQLMVLGPSRMEYSKVVALVEYVSTILETLYGDKGGEDG